ncbi:MAG: hypothetical protein GY749_34025 [Desulfobacteraceae bacterium]|nr:hypothetical protein [Desulfobacteraceae bacterium]
MNKIRYLFDEHIGFYLRKAVKKYDSDIVIRRVGEIDAPVTGTLDPDILIWCESNNFCLFTNNRKSMPKHLKDHLLSERHVPGIFVLNPKLSIDETAYELALIAGASDMEEFADRLIYLPIIK